MQFSAVFALVSTAVFAIGTVATKSNASISGFEPTGTIFISSIAANATAIYNGTSAGATSAIPAPAPTGTPSLGNGSFICFPVGAGFITDLPNGANGTNFPTGGNVTVFPTGVNGSAFPTGGNGTDFPFPAPTATGVYNLSTTIAFNNTGNSPVVTAFFS